MGEIVNLRAVRKAKARDSAKAQAETNRAVHGRTAAEKKRDRDEAARLAKIVDGAKLERDATD
ncbi:DUF4169 family protein [Sphingomonas sp. BIUV-7]|uniref:DUF4169 family protein n=1 Tax=Sphingomonas natans TaxID=3063330 RepID=A0ABT8YFA0_9SPHN|nr:DUF4169 family protein [Sphingomonas sp. BIUV-7]MDO6416503.1 DUF4169 family protein [Sphingomonas sp. BIUV-7]